jgi:SAM-dependent methyltransferase
MERLLEATAAAEDRHFWFRGLRTNARAALGRALAGRRANLIVDCGTGTGRNLDWLADFGRAVGVERSPTGLGVAHRHRRPVVAGSVTHLPLADGCAEVVTSFDVFVTLDDGAEREAAREMYRVLAPGGVALVHAAALDVLHGSHSVLTEEKRRYSRGSIRALLQGTGFAIDRVTYTNMITLPLVLAVRLKDQWTGQAATASEQDLQVPPAPVNAALGGLLSLESAWLRAGNLPVGSSILAVARKAERK